jgi:molybdopterin-guanine dinucleotide biosynthesis adapter protein
LRHDQLPPMVCIVGYSGTGKTTFIEKLIPRFTARGFRVGCLKHDLHGFEMDKPGKDTWRHKRAGATTTLISSPRQIGMVMDVDHDVAPQELRKFFDTVDIILAEGYKHAKAPKLEVFRKQIYDEPVCKGDDQLLALISQSPIDLGVPRFSPDDGEGVARFLIDAFGLLADPSDDEERLGGPSESEAHTLTLG